MSGKETMRFRQAKREIAAGMVRDSLYKAASGIISERGWDALTMDRLAKNSGMAKGTIYNYFRNKDEVLDFVVSRILEPMQEKILELDCENGDPEKLLCRMLDILIAGLFENPFALPALVEASERGHDMERLDRRAEAVQKRLRRLVERGVEEGAFKKCDPVLLVEFIRSVLAGIGLRMTKNTLPPMKDFNLWVKTMIVDGISPRNDFVC